ncbi:S8 family serine peptidase [Flavitalea sp.]|nr:S8 family serine peptidase [Flavitalea sp.]
MSRILTLGIFLVSVVCTRVNAQTKTNRSILEKASSDMAVQEQKDYLRLKSIAVQKSWPMLTKGKNGSVARLVGIDPAGNPLYITTLDNLDGAATIKTNLLWPGASTGLNLSGSSANMRGKLAIWDGGRILNTHVELNGRVTQKDNPASLEDHSTHVAGIMINSGVNPNAKGMAFGAQQLIAYDFTNHMSEMLAEAPNLLISNHSYGTISGWYYNDSEGRWEFRGEAGTNEDYKFGYYDNDARMWDSIAYNAPYYLIVKAAGNNRDLNGPEEGGNFFRYNSANSLIDAGPRLPGMSSNDGYDILPTYSVAKNVLTVGAVNPIFGGYLIPADVELTTFTSFGPTDDGRIKPDVVTDGINLLSGLASDPNAYAYLSGTSMSTPVASGSLFLLQEYYSRLHAGTFMRSATLKGLVIHTADEAGTAAGPDYKFGWGLVNMERAASVITSNNTDQIIREESLNNGATFSLPVVASGKGTLIATISWTDPKSSVNTTSRLNNPEKKLINDLDIKVTSGANTFLPYKMDPNNRDAPATTGDNILDNVEKIVIPGAVPGQTYNITISHKATLERGAQAYTLLVSGVGGQAYCSSTASATGSTRIESVQIGSVTNAGPATCEGYNNLTGITFPLQSGQTYPFSIKINSCNGSTANRIVKVFIDLNNNGAFEAGEMLAQSSVLAGNATFTGNIATPANMVVGNNTIMRVVAMETGNPADVSACGSYAAGQTIDLRAQVATPSKNVGITAIFNPSGNICALDSQMVTVILKNFGDVAQSNIPVAATVKNGAVTIATFNTVYPLTLAPYAEGVFTFQAFFNAIAGTTYTVSASTNLAGDQVTSNDAISGTAIVATPGAAPTGSAEQCGSNQVVLTRTGTLTSDKAYWYTTPTGGTPIASGDNTSTSVIPANRTYYIGLNDVKTKVGPPNKMVYPSGGYNAFGNDPNFIGNFVRFSTTGPMIIESARLYIGNPGKIQFSVIDISSETATNISYFNVSSTTIDVFATTPTPAPGLVEVNNPLDTGAVFALNLPIPEAGTKYAIMIRCLDGATIFRNNNIPVASSPYPLSIPETFSITGNNVTSPNDFRTYYYFFYDMKIDLLNCPTARRAVVAQSVSLPSISLNGSTLTSSVATGNQWFKDGAEIPGANGQAYSPTVSGVYKTVVTGASGCLLSSNEINFVSTAVIDISDNEIKLSVSPNPNDGRFLLQFEFKKKENLEITMVNAAGQTVYRSATPGFIGRYTKQIGLKGLPSGMYLIKIRHGKDVYVKKVMIAI